MDKDKRLEMDEMAQRFGFSLTSDEIGRILSSIKKKVENKY